MRKFRLVILFLLIISVTSSTLSEDEEEEKEKSLAKFKTAFVRYFAPLSSTPNHHLHHLPPSILEEFIANAKARNQSQLTALWQEVQSAVEFQRRLHRAMVKVRAKIIGRLGRKKEPKKSARALHQRQWTLVRGELRWAEEETARKVMQL